jgi:hypothetical protein
LAPISVSGFRGPGRHVAVHGSLILVIIGEPFAALAALKQLSFGGPLTPENIEGRLDLSLIALAYIGLAAIIAVLGRALWIAGTLLIHAVAMLFGFNTGWGYTVIPAAIGLITLWIAWTYNATSRVKRKNWFA